MRFRNSISSLSGVVARIIRNRSDAAGEEHYGSMPRRDGSNADVCVEAARYKSDLSNQNQAAWLRSSRHDECSGRSGQRRVIFILNSLDRFPPMASMQEHEKPRVQATAIYKCQIQFSRPTPSEYADSTVECSFHFRKCEFLTFLNPAICFNQFLKKTRDLVCHELVIAIRV